jgi:hypothetical protein
LFAYHIHPSKELGRVPNRMETRSFPKLVTLQKTGEEAVNAVEFGPAPEVARGSLLSLAFSKLVAKKEALLLFAVVQFLRVGFSSCFFRTCLVVHGIQGETGWDGRGGKRLSKTGDL